MDYKKAYAALFNCCTDLLNTVEVLKNQIVTAQRLAEAEAVATAQQAEPHGEAPPEL